MELSVQLLNGLLTIKPGLDKYVIVRLLHELGITGVTTHDLNAFIYQHQDVFEWRLGDGSSRLWFVKGGISSVPPAPATPVRRSTVSESRQRLDLYPWQQRALGEWQKAGHVGVVEAVTGAGKTRLALQAIADAVQAGYFACVIVPTIELMRQWHKEIDKQLIDGLGLPIRLAHLGGGESGLLDGRQYNVLLSSVQSGSRYQLLPTGRRGLLVADEVHHYGAETWAMALEPSFERRLGLTATYEREDNGLEEFLIPYFGRPVYSCDFDEALNDGVISPFRIGFIGVRFSPEEQAVYEEVSARASRLRKTLIDQFGLPADPFGQFIRECHQLAKSEIPEASRIAAFYLSAFTKRRAIMAESSAKLEALRDLAPAIKEAERTILFTQTKQAAKLAIETVKRDGIHGAVMSSEMRPDDRHQILADFEDGTHEIVAAPRLLDEGVDVPAADLAIILATSRSRRQLVQRMGRVLRRKADGDVARIAILYVEGTAEDPDHGAHEDFLEEVLDAAEEVHIFRPDDPLEDAVDFLCP